MGYNTKKTNFEFSVKDVDTKQGIVTGYFSAWNLDSDGDMIEKGAFSKTINERGPQSTKPRIQHLYNHDPYKPIGRINKLIEDDKGLYFESQMSKSQMGQDVLKLYDEKIITEHSIGFQTINQTQENGYNKITEIKLWEGSAVTWGANENTPLTGIKSEIQINEKQKSLSDRLYKIASILRKGNLTDQTFLKLEIEALQLADAIQALENQKEAVVMDNTFKDGNKEPQKQNIKAADIFNSFLKSYNNQTNG